MAKGPGCCEERDNSSLSLLNENEQELNPVRPGKIYDLQRRMHFV